MKLLLKNRRVTWRASLGVLIGAVAMVAAACAGGDDGGEPVGCGSIRSTRRAGHASSELHGHHDRLSVDGPRRNPPRHDHEYTGTGAAGLGSVKLTLQSGLTPVGVSNFPVSGKIWALGVSPIVSPDVIVGAAPGNNKLDPGDAISFDLAVTSSTCNSYSITSAGSNDTPENLTTTSFTSGLWTNTTGAVTVIVTGCVACDDKHAPAVANDYWMNTLGLPANDSRHGNVISGIGQRTSEDGTFTYNDNRDAVSTSSIREPG